MRRPGIAQSSKRVASIALTTSGSSVLTVNPSEGNILCTKVWPRPTSWSACLRAGSRLCVRIWRAESKKYRTPNQSPGYTGSGAHPARCRFAR